MRFEDLNIPGPVLEGIREAGFVECTPVQALTLPEALRGRDIAAQAQTGTGKTAAFLIAIFSRMLALRPAGPGPSPRALIIAPTRELVVQIEAEAKVLVGTAGFKIVPAYGGIDYEKQRRQIEEGSDILIGTPGRLIDYLKQGVYSLRKTQFLVIDEADRMFDMGFIADLRFLLRRMAPYNQRQSMLFSATLSHRVFELCYEHMNNPERFMVTPEQLTVEKIEQVLYHVSKQEKFGFLLGILRRVPDGRFLIFCNMKSTSERLKDRLNANGFAAEAITGDIPQKKRLRVLTQFKEGTLPILVATDVASRGLHIDGVTHVINYDLPQDAEDYVHRIGRTARAGAAGKAVSLACEDYVLSLQDIEDFIKQQIPVEAVTDEMIVANYRRTSGLHHTREGVKKGFAERRSKKRSGTGSSPSRNEKTEGRQNRSRSRGRSPLEHQRPTAPGGTAPVKTPSSPD